MLKNNVFVVTLATVFLNFVTYTKAATTNYAQCDQCEGASRFRCDYTYHPDIHGWLKFHIVPANWQNARLRCQLEGASLASPTPQLVPLLLSAIFNTTVNTIYTGIHSLYSNGDYSTIEGISLHDLNAKLWTKNEPNNFNRLGNCIVMNGEGLLGDVECETVLPYICYKEDLNESVSQCGTIDNEYKHYETTGKCYKVHNVPRNFSRAYMTCHAEGGHLAIIDNEVESQAITDAMSKYPMNTIVGRHSKDLYFIGVIDNWDQDGEWRTIHGSKSFYLRYAPNEPNNAGDDEHCGSVTRSGQFNDYRCNTKTGFICEKDPKSLQTCFT